VPVERKTDHLAVAIASGLGLGYAPVAPGTVGCIWGLLLAWVFPKGWSPPVLLALVFLGMWAAGRFEEISGKKDPGKIVIDEVCGMWLTCLPFEPRPGIFLACFLLFRFWDIVKPPLASSSQSLRGGLGVMADDLIAGIYSIFCVFILHWINLF